MVKQMQSTPTVSVILVNWNGVKWLKKCIDSVMAQSYPAIEIVLVDNDSIDGSSEFVKKEYPKVKLIQSDRNRGFAGGNNLGIKNAQGELIMLLNTDAWIEEDLVERLARFLQQEKLDVVGPYERKYDGRNISKYYTSIDPLGHPTYIRTREHPNFYMSGVCIMFRKDFYEATGMLDENFFMYFEEIDWFWRINLQQKKFSYLDGAYVYHAGAGSTGGGIKYISFLWRNQNTLQMLLKNYKPQTLVLILPLYLLQNIVEMLFFLVLLKPKISLSYIQGWVFNVRYFKRTMKARAGVQASRKISDLQLIKSQMYHGLGKLKHLAEYRRTLNAK
jgi:GT2 family glycosyltransferase